MGERSLYMYVLHIYLFWLIYLQRNISQICLVTRGWRPQFIHNRRQKNLNPSFDLFQLTWAKDSCELFWLILVCCLTSLLSLKTFHLLQNYATDFIQNWHIASFNEDDSSLYELRVTYSFKSKDTSSLE